MIIRIHGCPPALPGSPTKQCSPSRAPQIEADVVGRTPSFPHARWSGHYHPQESRWLYPTVQVYDSISSLGREAEPVCGNLPPVALHLGEAEVNLRPGKR